MFASMVLCWHRIPSSTPAVATPSKSGKSKTESEENKTYPTINSDSRLQMVNPQDLANKLHGLSNNQFEQHYAQSCANNRQPVQNRHQGVYLHPHNKERPLIHTGPPVPSTWPQRDIPLQHNLEHISVKEQRDYLTSCSASKPLANSPPEKLRKNLVRTADCLKVANCKETPKKNKSKNPTKAEKLTEPQGTEITRMEEKKDGVYNTNGKSSGGDFSVGQDSEEVDVTVEDTYSNVYVESNPR